MATPERDEISGVETTGHEWDGIKELNNPLPRWWLWTLYVTIIWAVIYMIFMPAWPLISDHTKGILGYSQRAAVEEQLDKVRMERAAKGEQLVNASLADIQSNPDLLQFAMAGGKAAFGDNCAGCHGSGAAGAPGYPNLNDDDWIWGGTLEDIHVTLLYGIRAMHDDTRLSDMPAFLKDEILEKEQISTLVTYVQSLSDPSIAAPAGGAELYDENCASCHMDDGKGNTELGSPNLTDGIWLYGGDRASIAETISYSRMGVMPNWDGRLDPATIKSLAIYVHSLGGGQ
ncbi:MAG: cytochrome-c oxidase, cbb3-type subunit III [Kordiimonas sp.]|nr:cytochrome-c oxidase, cbb3-type subunit III [Kordiimonas sp.]|tara:strand:+ start:850 stop:1710 length:861 start_codon:yes stop_codon:yes gene_type:complete